MAPNICSQEDFLYNNGEIHDLKRLGEDLALLLSRKDTADIVFVVGKEKTQFHLHSLILACRCRVYSNFHNYGSQLKAVLLTQQYPLYSAAVFRDVVTYIYTGKILLDVASVIEITRISCDLGIDSLTLICHNYVEDILSSANVCYFLIESFELLHSTAEHSAELISFVTELHEKCTKVLCLKAEDAVLSKDWLRLPKELFVRMFSSYNLSLNEDMVWYAIFSWAKHNVNIPLDKKPTNWKEEEKISFREALKDIVDHVRWMLIDSTLFVNEVEPTGIVPVEVVVARYRRAAISGQGFNNVVQLAPLIQPRQGVLFFKESSLLTGSLIPMQQLLNEWYGKPNQSWRLLFRASDYEFSAQSFHLYCNDHAPTVMFVKSKNGNICGGFTDVAWTSPMNSHGKFYPSNRAFLFTLLNNCGMGALKLPIVKTRLATLHHSNYGPIFGGGADLLISDKCSTNNDSYSNLSHSYSCKGLPLTLLTGDYNFLIDEYEVFTCDT